MRKIYYYQVKNGSIMSKNRLFRNGALVAIAGIAAFGASALLTDKAEAK